jgi:prenyltransferase beta subunit
MQLEGGFQGRPNKLVDGCSSFWVGGLFPLLEAIMTRNQYQFEKDVNQRNFEVTQYIGTCLLILAEILFKKYINDFFFDLINYSAQSLFDRGKFYDVFILF